MAIIGSIRERSGLLLVIIGGAMAAFILTDLFSGRGSGRQDQVLGTVGGEEISAMDYERRVNDEIESYRNDFGQQVNAQMTEQVRNSVWQEMLKEKVMMPQVEDAGFTLTKGEYDDIRFGQNIQPEFKNQPNFQGEDGQPSTEKLQQYFSSVQLNAPVYHEIQKRRLTENRMYAKYTTLIKKSVFVNSAQAKDDYLAKNTKANFSFVAKRYDSEPDSLYTVDDQSLRRYYDQHKGDRKFKQVASRKFEYVIFPVTASDEDRQATMQELNELKVAFETTSNDSLFVASNSESRTFNKAPYTEGTADKLNDSLIVNASVGTVVGPFKEGEQWKLVKVEELADVPEARVRHILLSTQGKDEDEQKAKADSILSVVKRDRSKFEDLVVKFSEDPGSNTKEKGGVYDWFDKTKMVPEFTAASFDEKVGAITIAKTDYGFHIVEVLGQRDRQERRVASIERSIKPSPATFKDIYKKANEFSLRNTDLASFKQAAEEQGLQVTPVDELRSDSRFVPGLQDANSIVTWVNREEVGTVSEPTQSGDGYVVAILTGIREAGIPKLDDVRETFSKEVVKQKKAEAWTATMQGKTDLNALATELGVSMQSAPELSYNSFSLPGGFSENEVIGKIFALDNGQTSVPLTGETAVYVASMTTKTAAPEPEDLNIDKASLVQRAQSRVDGGLFNAMKEAVGVTDERSKYY